MSNDTHMPDRTPYPEWWDKGKLGRPEQLREFIHDLLRERDRLRDRLLCALSASRSPRDEAVEHLAKVAQEVLDRHYSADLVRAEPTWNTIMAHMFLVGVMCGREALDG